MHQTKPLCYWHSWLVFRVIRRRRCRLCERCASCWRRICCRRSCSQGGGEKGMPDILWFVCLICLLFTSVLMSYLKSGYQILHKADFWLGFVLRRRSQRRRVMTIWASACSIRLSSLGGVDLFWLWYFQCRNFTTMERFFESISCHRAVTGMKGYLHLSFGLYMENLTVYMNWEMHSSCVCLLGKHLDFNWGAPEGTLIDA